MFGKNQPPKKRRKSRTAFTNQQIYELEKRFLYQKYLTPADRDEIAASLGLSNAQVITWFQNRRAKLKRDLEELKNDVSASKVLPPMSSSVSSSLSTAELELRKVQEKTLRESFLNGEHLQSPSSCSLASLSDDHEVSATPSRSPDKEDRESCMHSDNMDAVDYDGSGCDIGGSGMCDRGRCRLKDEIDSESETYNTNVCSISNSYSSIRSPSPRESRKSPRESRDTPRSVPSDATDVDEGMEVQSNHCVVDGRVKSDDADKNNVSNFESNAVSCSS